MNLSGTVVAKSIEATFVPQGDELGVVYEEGGIRRGFNLYTHRGFVFVGTWDTSRSAIESGDAFVSFISARIQRGKTTHAVMVFDAAAGTLQLYLDGELAAESFGVNQVGRHAADRGIGGMKQMTRIVAGARDGDGLNFKGIIDEVILYAGALSADTVREHAATTR